MRYRTDPRRNLLLQGKGSVPFLSIHFGLQRRHFQTFFFIFCNTLGPVGKNSCKHHQHPSGQRKAPLGGFSLGG